MIGLSLAAAVALSLAAIGLAGEVLSSAYSQLPLYVLILAGAYSLRGVTSLYASYLAAQAEGRALRNAGIVLTGTNVIVNFTLIPIFGGPGAAVASLIALSVNLAAHVVSYRRSLIRPQSADDLG